MKRLIYISATDRWVIHNFETGESTPVKHPTPEQKKEFWDWCDRGFKDEV